MKYKEIIKKLSQNINTAYTDSIYEHCVNKGDSREKALIQFLEKVMPNKYGFSSGEIFDIDNQTCGQVDIIIYDKLFSTIFTDGTDKIVAPADSTFGIISVKSKMGLKELNNAIKGIENYEKLQRGKIKSNTFQITADVSLTFPKQFKLSDNTLNQQSLNCIFAYDTTLSLNTIINKIKKSKTIDFLIIPDKYLIMGRNRDHDKILIDDRLVSYCKLEISDDEIISAYIMFMQLFLQKIRLKSINISNIIEQSL